MKSFLLLCIGALALIAAPDTNVMGNWSGTFVITDASGETKDSTAFLMLKQTGSDITGTVGPNEGQQHPIKSGKIEGDKITLLVDADGGTATFNLAVNGDRITGDVKMSKDGDNLTAKLDATRAK